MGTLAVFQLGLATGKSADKDNGDWSLLIFDLGSSTGVS
jgi:hypothetical protein